MSKDVEALEIEILELRRRLDEQSRDVRRGLVRMVESMADGLILTEPNTTEVLINPAARTLLNVAPDVEVTTQFLKDTLGFYPFDLAAPRPGSTNPPAPIREQLVVGGKTLHSIVSPVLEPDGTLVGVVVVLRDMTETHELARRQSEFLSVVSHELRTPLTSITGALDIVLGGVAGHLSDKQRRYLDMARESCTRLNLIVDDLLDVARSESGRMPLRFTPISLDQLSREVAARHQNAASHKRIELRVTTEARDIRILGDPDRLTQVLNNLLSNAIKFTPIDGVIELEVFGPSVAADHVGVSVFNNGEPIPEADRERVFEKFEQVQKSSTRQVGGTGLGLAISRAIIEAHRGRIWVEANDIGTKFVFTLPAAPADQDDPDGVVVTTERASTEPIVESDAVVLLVADEPHSMYILKGMLMALGYQVLLAETASSAIAIARSRRPDLVVVEAMQDPTETEAIVEIFNHDPDTRKTALMIIGGEQPSEPRLRMGAGDWLAKPVAPSLFHDTCKRLIAEAGREHATRILVVDDEATIRAICREMLENVGYTVREAADGDTALEEARRFRPDLVIVDIMMPGIDGFATAERLRSDTGLSMTPIIFVSAKGETADKVRAFRVGAEDYLVKPFDAAELIARVAKTISRHERELGASPTTQLPGADAIELEITRRLGDADRHAFCYLDLDNLKAFNDYYGYAKADGIIRQTGDLIREIVSRHGTPSDFIGHIAGDDFVLITSTETVDEVCTAICEAFNRLVPLYYNKVDRDQGFILTRDRYGIMREFPIMSISIAAVTSLSDPIASFSSLAAAAARGKKLAKSIPGSSYVRDEAAVVGQLPAQTQPSAQ